MNVTKIFIEMSQFQLRSGSNMVSKVFSQYVQIEMPLLTLHRFG